MLRFNLQWHVTERCNLRCAHCYQESQPASELTLRDLVAILDAFVEFVAARSDDSGWRRQLHRVTFTGGEPFLRQDLLSLLECARERRRYLDFAILTNGTLVGELLARRLRRLKPAYVQVSIEGTEQTHDRIRGSGSFAEAVCGIRHLVCAGVRVLISFTAHRGNYLEFPEVVRLGRRLGVDRVWADRLIPAGDGAEMVDLVLTPEETRAFVGMIGREWKRCSGLLGGRTRVACHRALQFLESEGCGYSCSAGDSLLTIMPDGTLFPCRRMPIPVGNVRQTPLDELYDGSRIFAALRDRSRVSAGCERCAYERGCRGGLKCLSYAVSGNPFVADPGCWLAERGTRRDELSRRGNRQEVMTVGVGDGT